MSKRAAWKDGGVKDEGFKTELEKKKKRKKDDEEVVNADSGEESWEIKQATSAIGSLTPPFSFLLMTFYSSKTLQPPLLCVSPLFIPPYESSPRLPLPNQNYSGCHCLLDSLAPVCSSLLLQDRPAPSWPTDHLIEEKKTRKKKKTLCYCSMLCDDKL